MISDRPSCLSRTLPCEIVTQMGESLAQTAQLASDSAFVVTALELPTAAAGLGATRFTLVVSHQFSGLLTVSAGATAEVEQVQLTFEPTAIAHALTHLSNFYCPGTAEAVAIDQALQQLQPNDGELQGAFTLQLLELVALTPPSISEPPKPINQQVEQAQLLSQVMTQIWQSTHLTSILETTVQQVRQVLQADRVVIYEFNQVALTTLDASPVQPLPVQKYGEIRYEARANAALPTVVNLTEGAHCFADQVDYREKYRQGNILAVTDTEATFANSTCLLRLLQQAKVRAKLVVPIVVQAELWGLLIAHQTTPRHWQASDQTFLCRIAEQLAIAIYQASIYAQLQHQKQQLEKFADQRTQELYDVLEAAQAANLVKTEFLATMSHELRTPLTSILGITNTLLRLQTGGSQPGRLSPERQQGYLKTIQASGDRLLQIINDILDMADVEAGQSILQLQPFSLSQIAKGSLQACRQEAGQKQLTLELDNRLKSPLETTASTNEDIFWADSRRVERILFNLLSNAIKFTPTGGHITLRLWREHNTVVFQVEDTGIGISEEQRSLLFKKFQQLDMSTQRTHGGVGVGLALSKQLIELHRGWIEVESALNRGSTFTVWLPEQLPERDRPPLKVAPPNCLLEPRRRHIVLIEEDEELADLICDLLTMSGYQVVWLVDSSVVMQQVAILQPLVAIISTQLSNISATEILHYLQTMPITEAVQVLMLLHPAESEQQWLDQGAADTLAEAIAQPEQLLTKVAALVETGQTIRVA